MLKYIVPAVFVLILAGCAKDKIEVPKDAKPGPTAPGITIGGGGPPMPGEKAKTK